MPETTIPFLHNKLRWTRLVMLCLLQTIITFVDIWLSFIEGTVHINLHVPDTLYFADSTLLAFKHENNQYFCSLSDCSIDNIVLKTRISGSNHWSYVNILLYISTCFLRLYAIRHFIITRVDEDSDLRSGLKSWSSSSPDEAGLHWDFFLYWHPVDCFEFLHNISRVRQG